MSSLSSQRCCAVAWICVAAYIRHRASYGCRLGTALHRFPGGAVQCDCTRASTHDSHFVAVTNTRHEADIDRQLVQDCLRQLVPIVDAHCNPCFEEFVLFRACTGSP